MSDIVERCGGPHEWGYRDVTDGTFIPDNAPFEAATEIERLRDLLAFYGFNPDDEPEGWKCRRALEGK